MWEMLLAYHFSNIFHMGYRGDMKVLRSQQADLVSSHPESRWEENKHAGHGGEMVQGLSLHLEPVTRTL